MTVIEIKYSDAYDPAVVTTRAKLALAKDDQPLRFELTERVTQAGKGVFVAGLALAAAASASKLLLGSVVLLSLPTALMAATALAVIGIAAIKFGPLYTKENDKAALINLISTWNQNQLYGDISLADWLVSLKEDPSKLTELLDHINASQYLKQFDQAVIYLQRYVRFDDIAKAILNQPVVNYHLDNQENYRIEQKGDESRIYKKGKVFGETLQETPKALFNILEDLRKSNALSKEQKEEITKFALSLNKMQKV